MIDAVDVRIPGWPWQRLCGGLAFATALVLGVRANGSALQPPAATARPPLSTERAMVRVATSDPWVDTGLRIEAGDRVVVRAWGSINVDKSSAARVVGPNGVPFRGRTCEHLIASEAVREHALVLDVAPALSLGGHGVGVGANWEGTSPIAQTTAATGALFLGINHNHMACDRSGYDSWALRNDSSGAFTVEVTIARRR